MSGQFMSNNGQFQSSWLLDIFTLLDDFSWEIFFMPFYCMASMDSKRNVAMEYSHCHKDDGAVDKLLEISEKMTIIVFKGKIELF